MRSPTRRNFGRHFSEGARLLWEALPALAAQWGVDEYTARRELARRIERADSSIARYLYGDRLPDRASAIKLAEVAGVPAEAWDLKPSVAFVLPADRPDPDATADHAPVEVDHRPTGT